MKRYLGIDGVQACLADRLRQLVWVMAMLCFFVAAFIALICLLIWGRPAHAQEPQVGWQLGICVDDQFRLTTCRLIGGPLPDEQLCKGLRDSLKARINAGRVHCTRVLIDAQGDID